MAVEDELVDLARRLDGFEFVPGVEASPPVFETTWKARGVDLGTFDVPEAFAAFVSDPGGNLGD